MGLISEFKEFAAKGNVVDMAVGIIVGGAFGKIVTSLVEDLVMPPIGLLIGGIHFAELKIILKHEKLDAAGKVLDPAVSINYGNFIQITVSFIIVAWIMFLMIKAMNAMRHQEAEVPAPPAEPTNEEKLLTEIRDLLKDRR